MELNKCPYSKKCGACQLQDFSYEQQLLYKQKEVVKLLGKFNHVENIIACKKPLYYRNKVQVSFALDKNHKIYYGNYVTSSHEIVKFDECFINDENINKILNDLTNIFNKYHLNIFDEDKLKGCLRHLLIRCTNLNEYMLTIVTGKGKIDNIALIIKEIIALHPNIKTIIQNINDKHTSMVLGNKYYVLYGKGYIYDKLCGLLFRISPSSFYQVNKYQTEVLYHEVLKLAKPNINDVVVDAYCGTGTIGLTLANKVKSVLGIEINKEAVKDGIINMKLNELNNVYFINDDASSYMAKMAKENLKIDLLIMDPPRTGSTKIFIESTFKLAPKKIVYVSCNPETLKNDLKLLIRKYEVKKIQPVDMFPYTKHVETVVLLSRK